MPRALPTARPVRNRAPLDSVGEVTISDSGRREAPLTRLARLGFNDPQAALTLLEDPAFDAARLPDLLDSLAEVADPDLAVRSLARVLQAGGRELRHDISASPREWRRLLAVLGSSAALGDHLVRHPEHYRSLADDEAMNSGAGSDRRSALLAAVGADPASGEPVAAFGGPEALDALRVAYRRELIAIAGLDLTAEIDLEQAAADLSDLAAAALDAGLAIARADLPPDAPPCRLAVIGMGKLGGRELNYVSDVDVVFVAEPEAGLRTASALAAGLMRACSATTAEGSLWPVDAALRPEGNAGALVRTVASHQAYYQRWAKTWEFQALLKARPVAGDVALGHTYVDAVAPLVWSASDRDGFVQDVQAMRRRVEEHIPADQADRQLKLGRGGLRDVEFAVQLLQLVHGRGDETLRRGSTLDALRALAAGGYVGRADAAQLDDTYQFLRSLEHRLQLYRLRRTHTLPEAESELRRLGRALGYRGDPIGELTAAWRERQRTARRLHEKLFYRPLLIAVSRLHTEDARLTPQAARHRLEALGYADPAGALRHIQALTTGVTRRAAIQRTLLPVMLGWFADAADPDGGLLAFRQVSEALGTTPWYLRLLRDEGATAQRLARVLASSRYASDLLLRAPEAVAMLADDSQLRPVDPAVLRVQVRAAVSRAGTPAEAAEACRAVRRRELLRICVADLLGDLSVDEVGEALTTVTAAVLDGGLAAAIRSVAGADELPTALTIVAMGRLGGHEQGYASDADVLFIHDPRPGADERTASDAAQAVANELRRLLALPAPDPPLVIDAGLRPEGRQGPLVRTLASYLAYYERWGEVWERQALLRAEPVAGDTALGARFIEAVDPIRYPSGGLDPAAIREIRRIKARVEGERLPRGADPRRNTKLGPGGLADVEWTVQLLQMRYGDTTPTLRTTRTMDALDAAVNAGLVEPVDTSVLSAAWRLASRVRSATTLVRGRPQDSLPSDARELAGVARLLGYAGGGPLVEDYRRMTRRARATVERIFYA
jgi:[glutamine synthetase] adenylyltransferase / [glutamine synthetase]-adenylyl-L-tyrosine phosphorylase